MIRKMNNTAVRKKNVIIFPHAGGSDSIYCSLGRLLNKEYNVFFVHYSSIYMNKPYSQITEIVNDFYKCWKKFLYNEYETIIIGCSLGAVIAYECLRSIPNINVKNLVIFSCESPNTLKKIDFLDENIDIFFKRLYELGGCSIDFLNIVELKKMFYFHIFSDFCMYNSYTIESESASLKGINIYIFVGNDDPLIDSTKIGENWSNFTSGQVSLYVFAGGHFFMKSNENIFQIYNIINNLAK